MTRTNLCARITCLVLGMLLLGAVRTRAQVIYVDPAATGPVHDGTSWCSAFLELYEALAAAPPGAMIRAADGLYLPDTDDLPDPRNATFIIPPGLTVSGGYAGCGAPDPDERDPLLYVSRMSGDLDGDDPDGNIEDNVFHVLSAAAMPSLTTLSGWVIEGGNAGPAGQGGGILAPGGRLTLSVCTLRNNHAWRGGAVYIEMGELHLFQCIVTGNQSSGEGGAVFDAAAELEAHNCLFALNTAGNDGGAIFSDLCRLDLLNCSFGQNHSASRGGAIYEYVGVVAYAGNCVFWDNSDSSGGGEYSQIFVNPSNILEIDYSCVQGWTGAWGGEGNMGEDPLWVDSSAGDLHLLPDSPCIDRGSNDLVASQLDLDGNPRIVNGTVDMGCYEFPPSTGAPDSWPPGEGRILSIDRQSGRTGCSLQLSPPRRGAWTLAVYDASGRRLAVIARGLGGDGTQGFDWDARDQRGRLLPSGVLFFSLEREGRVVHSRKQIYLR